VSSDNIEPDEQEKRGKPTSELWGPWIVPGSETQQQATGQPAYPPGVDPQAPFREHVSGPLYAPPRPAPPYYPGYPPPGQAPYPGYYPGYPGYSAHPGYAPYPGYPYPVHPPVPKRDGYLLGVGITTFIGSILALLAGLFSMFITLILPSIPNQSLLPQYELFGAEVLFTAFALFGIIGGIAGLYHSIRSVFMNRPSRHIYLPPFWIFVILYAAVIAIAFVLYSQGQAISNPPLDTTLILLSGLTPALAILALGERRLRTREEKRWPTSWRRFIVALISGGTLAIVLAAVLELALISALARGTGVAANLCLSNPNDPSCTNPNTYGILLVTLAIVAPLVEEMVKPLAVIILIGRVRSAIEAFALGLACGIGFDLIETSGYIAFGYQNWMATALSRTGTGLLHGFGAAMVALGWYYLSHPGNQHTLKAVGCWLYAIAQHAIWNGSWGLALLPGQLGQFFANLQLTIGPVTLDYYELALIIEAILILAFFLYMTGRLRRQAPSTKVEKVALAR